MTEPFLTLQLHLSLHPALGAHVPSTAFLPELMGAHPENRKKKKGKECTQPSRTTLHAGGAGPPL